MIDWSVNHASGKVTRLREKPSVEGTFGVVNLNYDQRWVMDDGRVMVHVSRPTRNGTKGVVINGAPDTARFMVAGGLPDTVDLHSDLQLWWHSLCRERIPSASDEDAKAAWRSLTSGGGTADSKEGRFMTDYAGTDTRADYVTGVNLNSGVAKAKPMVCGGSILKIIGERKVGGTDCYVIEAIDPVANYRQFNPRDHFWLFFYPTISRREPTWDSKGNFVKFLEYLSVPFPQYKNKALAPVFGAAGRASNFIQKDRVRLIDINNPLPSPFRNSTVAGYVTPLYPNPYNP